jgi:hypothetical protein
MDWGHARAIIDIYVLTGKQKVTFLSGISADATDWTIHGNRFRHIRS